jgi:hypothetical protein
MRDIDTELATLLAAPSARLAILVQFDFDSQTIGMWTGYGTLIFNEVEFLGGGELLEVSQVSETEDLQASGVVIRLTGIDQSLRTIALTERITGRRMQIFLAVLDVNAALAQEDDAGAILQEDGSRILLESHVQLTYRLFTGLMDSIEWLAGSDGAVINLSVENVLTLLRRSKERRYTDADQKSVYPDDRGLEFIAQLQDKEIVW